MTYSKQTWQDNVSVLSAAHFNHMEDGIYDAFKSLRIPNITVETGVAHGDFIYPVVENDQEVWKTDDAAGQANGRCICGPVDGNTADAVRAGIMPMPAALIAVLMQADIDARYSLYIQPDGNLGLLISGVHAGFILSDAEMIVDLNPANQKPKAYTDNMAIFTAMPGKTGINPFARFQVKLPNGADSVDIRYKDTAWTEGDDENTGTRIAELTDDTDLYGAFQWYEPEITGKSNGDFIYVKAFPKRSGMINRVIGANEVATSIGMLIHEYIPSDISGASVPDNVGSINGSGVNLSKSAGTGKIGDSMDMSAGYFSLSSYPDFNGLTIVLGIQPTAGAIRGLFSQNPLNGGRGMFGFWEGNTIKPGIDVNYGSYDYSGYDEDWDLVGVYWQSGWSAAVRVNDGPETTYGGSWPVGWYAGLRYIGQSNDFLSGTRTFNYTGKMDVVRLFSGHLTDTDWANLLNNGNWQ